MLINEKLANLEVATPFGTIVFDEKGQNNDLKPEEQNVLGALAGFEYKEDKKPAPKAEVKAESKGDKVASKPKGKES